MPVLGGGEVALAARSVCVHGDTPGAVALARGLLPRDLSVGDAVAGAFLPIYAGTVVAGHIVGRWEARQVSDERASNGEPFETALSGAIERLPAVAEAEAVPDSIDQCVGMQTTDESLLAAIAN
jgi:hypothetical protein